MRYAIVVIFVVLLAMSHPVQPSIAGTMLPVPVSAASDVAADADNPDAELARIRAHIQPLLLKLQFAGAN